MHTSADDLAIISSVLQGRQSDYAILVNRYRQYVFTLTLRYVPEREQAEELAQDVFVKAYANLHSFRGDSKFTTWLYTIVHTTCLSHLRRRNNSPVLVEEDRMVALLDAAQHEHPATHIEQKSKKILLEKALKQLPESEGRVLHLFYQASQSVEEIATITGTTSANVKVRLFRARQHLKEIIENRYKKELID